MPKIFPDAPTLPATGLDLMPACEWVMPAPSLQRRDYAKLVKRLPAGMPDCIDVRIIHFKDGTERSTAAVYRGSAYLIHYEYKRRSA